MMIMVREALLLLLFSIKLSTSDTTCPSGYHLSDPLMEGLESCLPCPPGSYISENKHSTRHCTACSKITNPLVEAQLIECSTTQDSVIVCRTGYSRRSAPNPHQGSVCVRCAHCPVYPSSCRADYIQNRSCCAADQEVTATQLGLIFCQDKPEVTCGPGFYLSLVGEDCVPCPSGTFMSDENHTHTSCHKCRSLSGNTSTYAIVLQPCNQTSPTLFGCQEGFFRDLISESSLSLEVGCTSCSECQKDTARCQKLPFFWCGAKGYLRANDESEQVLESLITGYQNVTACGDGTFFYFNSSYNYWTCQPCSSQVLTEWETSPPSGCLKTSQNTSSLFTDFRACSILFFVLALLVDMLYILLYIRNFLRVPPGNVVRRNLLRVDETASRILGTVGVDIHLVFACIHFFGILCESNVISLNENSASLFMVFAGGASICLFVVDAVLFLFVKQMVCSHVCLANQSNGSVSVRYSSDDDQAFLDSS